MKKTVLSLFFLFLCQPLSAVWLDNLLLECIATHNKAFLELAPHRDLITIDSWTQYCGNTITTNYSYITPTPEAGQALKNYREALDALFKRAMLNGAGDGFILGIIAACINKAFNSELINKKTIVGIVVATIAVTAAHNYKIGTVPYFTYYTLLKSPDFFSYLNPHTWGRLLCMLGGATAGYIGTNYIFTQLAPEADAEIAAA